MFDFMKTIHYEHPHLIWCAIPGSILVLALAWLWWRGRVIAILEYGNRSLVTRFTKLPGLVATALTFAGLVSVVVLGCAAATMPYRPLGAVRVPAGALRIAVAFDVSKSMAAEDYRSENEVFGGKSCASIEGACGSRIAVAKQLLLTQVMPSVAGNQMAMVVYAGGVVTRSFLNDDFRPLRQMMGDWHWVDVGSALGNGSYVDVALKASVKILTRDKSDANAQNVILLFTDGGNDSSQTDLAKAEAIVKDAHARLIIVGVGSTRPAAIPLYDDDDKPTYDDHGRRKYFLADEDKKVATTARDDAFMQQLASETGGQFIKVVPGEPLAINWPRAMAGTKVETRKEYLYQYPLGAAVFILALLWLNPLWSRLSNIFSWGASRRTTADQ